MVSWCSSCPYRLQPNLWIYIRYGQNIEQSLNCNKLTLDFRYILLGGQFNECGRKSWPNFALKIRGGWEKMLSGRIELTLGSNVCYTFDERPLCSLED